jgi:Tfp pilus assembly protein PilN
MSDVNLIPAGRLAARWRRARLVLWIAACGLYAATVATGSLTFHVAHAGENDRPTGQLDDLARQLEEDSRTAVDLRRQLVATNTALETTKAILGQPDWSRLLRGLSAQLGEEIVLSRYQLTTQIGDNKIVNAEAAASVVTMPLGAFLTGCRYTMTLNGFGQSQDAVSRFVLRLEGSGVFDRVRLVSSSRQTFGKGEAVAFVVECHF